ncbi:MAG: FAD-dependent oxidoreductase [Flammeovirgaceae bacterium]
MNRKEFLFRLGLLTSLGVLLPNVLSSCQNDEEEEEFAPDYKGALNEDVVTNSENASKTVVVVGAGIAGLAAATRLKKYGFHVIVIEGRDRIGGRILTDKSWGIPADMGASWIHGPSGNPISYIVDKAKINTYLTNDEDLIIYDQEGKEINEDIMDEYFEKYESLLDEIEDKQLKGVSLRDAIQNINPAYLNDIKMIYQLSAYAEFDAGGPIEELDAAYWEDDLNYKGKDVLFPNGYDAVINYLSQGLDIVLNQKVEKIDYTGSKTEITTDKAVYNADAVIVTVPLGVLKKNTITFSPSLPPQKISAINRLKMGYVNKVFLKFPSTFWDNQQYIGFTSEIKGKFNYFLNANKFAPNSHILLTFGFGNYGLEIENKTDEAIQDEIMTILKKIYGSDIPNPDSILVSRWNSDPFSYGAYSFVNVGASSDDFNIIAESVDNKLYFAGEHTSKEYRGTVHGAFASGQREADKIGKK